MPFRRPLEFGGDGKTVTSLCCKAREGKELKIWSCSDSIFMVVTFHGDGGRTMKCPNCGMENREGALFCMECGKGLSSPRKSQSVSQLHESMSPSFYHGEVKNEGFKVGASHPIIRFQEEAAGTREPGLSIPLQPLREDRDFEEEKAQGFQGSQNAAVHFNATTPYTPEREEHGSVSVFPPGTSFAQVPGSPGIKPLPMQPVEVEAQFASPNLSVDGLTSTPQSIPGIPSPGWPVSISAGYGTTRGKASLDRLSGTRLRLIIGGALVILCSLFVLFATFSPWINEQGYGYSFDVKDASGWDIFNDFREMDLVPLFDVRYFPIELPIFTGLTTLIMAVITLTMGILMIVLSRRGFAFASLILFSINMAFTVTNIISFCKLGSGTRPGEGLIVMAIFSVLGIAASIISLTGKSRKIAVADTGWQPPSPPQNMVFML